MFKNLHKSIIAHVRRLGLSLSNRKVQRYTDPRINRWTGKPHEHKREIARRLRQAARHA